jgi:hypothetical protein
LSLLKPRSFSTMQFVPGRSQTLITVLGGVGRKGSGFTVGIDDLVAVLDV